MESPLLLCRRTNSIPRTRLLDACRFPLVRPPFRRVPGRVPASPLLARAAPCLLLSLTACVGAEGLEPQTTKSHQSGGLRPPAPPKRLRRSRILEGLGQSSHQLGGVNTERCCHLENVEQRRVDLAPLEVTDVGPVEAGGLTERFLAHLSFEPEVTDTVSKGTSLLDPSPCRLHADDCTARALHKSTANI